MINSQLLPKPNRIFSSPKIISRQKIAESKIPILLFALHLPLGIALYNSSALSIIHPYAALFLGLYWAMRREEKIEKVAWVAAYIVGAEVLWRMAESSIFWEFGKYASAAIMIVALISRGYTKIPTLPLLYFSFLIPACILTVINNDLWDAKDDISFNISGPFLLLVSCWFFFHVKVDSAGLLKILIALIMPLFSVAVTTLFYTFTATEIAFNGESNFATSGGFGPNQVSAMLGLGAFACIAVFLILPISFGQRIFFGILILFFLGQGVLTFSRGGTYNAIGAALAMIIIQMRDPNSGIKRILPFLGIAVLFLMLVFPFLNDFTGGSLQERFEDSEPTGRVEIIESDYAAFMENPIFGVGVGAASEYRAKFINFKAASHTEFSRILSEHGAFGVLSLVALILITIFNFQRQDLTIGKSLSIGVIVWSLLFMMNAGMRLAAPSLILGMSYITISNYQKINQGNFTHR